MKFHKEPTKSWLFLNKRQTSERQNERIKKQPSCFFSFEFLSIQLYKRGDYKNRKTFKLQHQPN